MKQQWDLFHHGDKRKGGTVMAGMILRKTGVVLLTILKGLLHAALMILKLLFGGLKLFLLLLALIVRVLLSLVGIAAHD